MSRGDEERSARSAGPEHAERMPLAKFLALAVGVVVVLWAVGFLPTRRLAGEGGFPAMLVGGMLAFAASAVGTLPLVFKRGRPPVDKVGAVLGSIALRLGVVLVLSVAAVLSGLLDTKPFLAWVIVSHLGLLVADTLFARAELRADDPAGAVGAGGGEQDIVDRSFETRLSEK